MCNAAWWSSSSGRIELEIEIADAQQCTHSGRCDDDVQEISQKEYIAAQLAQVDPATLRDELREYGSWEDDELSDHDQNLQRLIWLAAGDLVDEANEATV